MIKETQDTIGSNCLKGVSGKVIVDEIKDSWKEYVDGKVEYQHELKKDQQIVSGSMKLLQH